MTTLYVCLILLSTVWALSGVYAVYRVRRRARLGSLPMGLPEVSVLKPLCGADDALEANLRTFFEQDFGDFELVFGVEGEHDPALAVVRSLRAEYPAVPTKIVVHAGGRGINPKVSNLRAMLTAVSHDVIVISDSNVRVGPHYLRRMASELAEPNVGLVTSLFCGAGEKTVGALVESLHLAGGVAHGMALANELAGHAAVVGKSMMFRRSTFERLGGFASVANVLAEDYVMGRMFDAAGLEVRVCSESIEQVAIRTKLSSVFRRHVRWGMMRVRLAPFAYLLEPLTIPLALAFAAPAFGVSSRLPLLWAVAVTLLRDGACWRMLRGRRGLLRALPFFPLRDLVVLSAWASAPWRKHVSWRGNRVRVSAGSRLYAETEPVEATPVLVEG